MLNGWAMLAGGALLLAVSALAEAWEVTWSARAVGSIAYLAVIGSAVPFVTLTILLRELPAVTMSYITLLLPFGALAFGAALYDEPVTLPAVAGAALVACGLLVAQWHLAPAAASAPPPGLARVAHDQLHVAVALAPARVAAAVLAVVGVGVVEGELARDRGELLRRRPDPLARVGRRVVVEDRAPDRDGPVGVVDEVEQPRLLRPVDVRGRRDLPEAALRRAVAARHRADAVVVLVAGDEADHGRVAQEQALDRLEPGRVGAAALARGLADVDRLVRHGGVVAGRERARDLVHRLQRVVGEDERELAGGVRRAQLAVEPAELLVVDVAAVAAGVRDGVEHHEAHAGRGLKA